MTDESPTSATVTSRAVASLPAETPGTPFLPTPSRTAASLQPQDSVASIRRAPPQHASSLRSISPCASIHPPQPCGTADEQPQNPGSSNSPAPSHPAASVRIRSPVTPIPAESGASRVPSSRTTLRSGLLKWPVIAVDILENGEVCTHEGYMDADDEARIDCPVQPKTMRVLLCSTPNVFVRSGERRQSESHGKPERRYTRCEACIRPTPSGGSIRSVAGSPLESSYPTRAPSVSSQAETEDSHVSPHTRRAENPQASVLGGSYITDFRSLSDGTHESKYNKRWKHYQAACGVTCNDLLHFWNRDLYPDAGSLTLGANIAIDHIVAEHDERIWTNAAFNERHQIMFTGDPLTFFTLPNLFLLSWKDDSLEGKSSDSVTRTSSGAWLNRGSEMPHVRRRDCRAKIRNISLRPALLWKAHRSRVRTPSLQRRHGHWCQIGNFGASGCSAV